MEPSFSKTKLLESYCSAYPEMPTLSLAKLAYKENPFVWNSIETTRTALRMIRGNIGEEHRAKHNDKQFYRPNQMPKSPFELLPEPLESLDNWERVKIEYTKALILPDMHIPYYDKVATIAALEYSQKENIDTIILNGDAMDFFSVSFWQKDPRKRDFPQELEMGIQSLEIIKSNFPNAHIVYKLGNHEERYERFMQVKAPELLGQKKDNKFDFKSIMELDRLDITLVDDMKPIMLGKLHIIHGHEFRFAISNPVNPARGVYNRAKDFCLSSHCHQTSEHSESGISGDPVVCWSTGCLSELHPDYMPINKWNHGFAIVKNLGEDEFYVKNKKIVHGKVF